MWQCLYLFLVTIGFVAVFEFVLETIGFVLVTIEFV